VQLLSKMEIDKHYGAKRCINYPYKLLLQNGDTTLMQVPIKLQYIQSVRIYRWFNSEVANLQKVGFEIIAFSWKNGIT